MECGKPILLQEHSLNAASATDLPEFHKDLTLERVNRLVFFHDHLIIIQQEQRNAVYHFSEHVKDLRKSVASLENLYSSSTACDNGTDSKCFVAPN